MSNHVEQEILKKIRELDRSGLSLRAIARAVGCSTNTVARHVGKAAARVASCKCGREAGHRGWCIARYASSVRRQAYHAARRGETIQVPPAVVVSRQANRTASGLRLLGLDGKEYQPAQKDDHHGAWGEICYATKNLTPDIMDDTRQHMFVSFAEGRMLREEIKRSVPVFSLYYRLGMHRSYNELPSPDRQNEAFPFSRHAIEQFWAAEFNLEEESDGDD